MANTRRLTQHSDAGSRPATSSAGGDKPAQSTLDRRTSRTLKNLQIDGNPALGGSGTLKRKRGQKVPGAFPPPTPPRSLSVPSQHISPTTEHVHSETSHPRTSSSRSSRLSAAIPPPASIERWGSVEQVAPLQPNDSRSASAELDVVNDDSNSAYWFLPSEALSLLSCASEDDSSQDVEQPESDWVADDIVVAVKADDDGDGLGEEAGQKTLEYRPDSKEMIGSKARVAKTIRTVKPKRELKNLVIHANPALSLQSPDDDGLVRPRSNSRRTTRRSQGGAEEIAIGTQDKTAERNPDLRASARESRPSVQKPQQTKVDRELRKLQIHANESWVGTTASPVTSVPSIDVAPEPTQRFPRRQRQIRPVRPNRLRKSQLHSQPRVKSPLPGRSAPIQLFPKDPPAELVDHILFLLASAAGERDLVAALQTTAQHAIARDVRWEASAARDARIQRELNLVDDWAPLNEASLKVVNDMCGHQEAIESHAVRRQMLLDGTSGSVTLAAEKRHAANEKLDESEDDDDSESDGELPTMDAYVESEIIVNSDSAGSLADESLDCRDSDEIKDEDDPVEDNDRRDQLNNELMSASRYDLQSEAELGHSGSPVDSPRRWKGKGCAEPQPVDE